MIEDIIKYNSEKEILRLYSSVYLDIERQLKLFYKFKNSNKEAAVEYLKNALTKATNIIARINYYLVDSDDNNINILSKNDSNKIKIDFIIKDLKKIETTCKDIKTKIDNGEIDWDEAALFLKNENIDITKNIIFPYPKNYKDLWGR